MASHTSHFLFYFLINLIVNKVSYKQASTKLTTNTISLIVQEQVWIIISLTETKNMEFQTFVWNLGNCGTEDALMS
jgi:hypothetical protein